MGLEIVRANKYIIKIILKTKIWKYFLKEIFLNKNRADQPGSDMRHSNNILGHLLVEK